MSVTIEEAKAFIEDGIKYRDNWHTIAKRSWQELKKRQENGKLWSITPNAIKKRSRYPAWYSIFRIRQPLTFARLGIPIGRDTTQDGEDEFGSGAAICLERLAVNLAKSFDMFDVLCACRDDFLATNVCQARGYYEREEIKEMRKIRIQPQKDAIGNAFFVDENFKVVKTDNISEDDQGFFYETKEVVDVENEKICLEPVLWSDFIVEPDSRRWGRVKRIAFLESYSEPEFIEIFGRTALTTMPTENRHAEDGNAAGVKRRNIKVWEYWDLYAKETKWFIDGAGDFITPKNYSLPEEFEQEEQPNGLYDLDKFFPCPQPCIINAPSDEFWPVPEYYQLVDIFEDVHSIFSRMVQVTKAIRTRLLFDNNVEGLEAALKELSEAEAIGVPNLAQALTSAGGSLENVVQYIPVEALINGLNQLYIALENRLNTIYKLSGTSDLLQGFVTDTTDRTFGERQMQEKYALNQQAEPSKKFQDFVRDCYQLVTEMALKNFKDETLARYIMPQTLDADKRQNYPKYIELLKNDTKRFRIELETDSTIAINEDYDKKMRVELVNTLTTALEKTAQTAVSNPALVVPELHCLKFLIQGFRQGKLFQTEVTEAIDNIIEQAKNAPPPPDPDAMTKAQMAQQAQIEQMKVMSAERIKMAELQQSAQIAAIQNQLDTFKAQSADAEAGASLKLDFQKVQAQIGEAQQQVALKRDELLVEMRKIADKKEVDQFQSMIDSSLAANEIKLTNLQQQLEGQKVMLDEKEKFMTEERLSSEHELEKIRTALEVHAHNLERTQAQLVNQQTAPVINVHVPEQKLATVSRTTKVKRDEMGNIDVLEHTDTQDLPVG